MKKKILQGLGIALGLFLLANFILFGFSTRDYGYKCTRCLREYQIVKKQFYGITYWKTEKLEFAGHDMSSLTGSSCQHIYRTEGFGVQTATGMLGCGMTGEGTLFRYRWRTLDRTFTLYERFANKELLKRSFDLVDTLLPADTTLSQIKDPRLIDNQGHLALLESYLENANSEKDWEQALIRTKAELAK